MMNAKAKPILFSTPMVQAILAGRKTQTRRVINNLPHCPVHGIDPYFTSGVLLCKGCDHFPIVPKYKPGDILWVKEKWRFEDYQFVDGSWSPVPVYADGTRGARIQWGYMDDEKRGWHSSTVMPGEAARIFLRVTDVRAERLQDINEASAIAEGVPTENPMEPIYCPACDGDGFAIMCVNGGALETDCPHCDTAVKRYANLWNNLNAKRGYGWDTNPWVWVYVFERCEAGGW